MILACWHAIVSIWRSHQRTIDMQILWPICKRETNDLDHARAIFAVHAFNDPAWLALGEEELFDRIDHLQ
jgi:hypothetical protein